jgi:transketolase
MNQSETLLKKRAGQIRSSILEMIVASGSSHIAAAFSITDILTVLYFDILNIDPKKPKWEDRDRFLLSKGHGGAALYATLAHRGFAPLDALSKYARDGSAMAGHIVKDSMPGVETTAGSLGHGLPMAIGRALALKGSRSKSRVFVLVGDGECNEGTTWEGALVAAQFKLDNLVLIVDRNGEQSLGKSDDVLNLEPFAQKWRAFGWTCLRCNGHNFTELRKACDIKNRVAGKPTVIIAKTQKGKGVTYMEKDPLSWHYKTPKDEFLERARKELNA